MEKLTLYRENKQLDVKETDLSGSKIHQCMMNNWDLNDVAMRNCKIVNADLSDLEIEGAQLGGAFIHNIGGPPKGHPAYDPNFVQRPLRFEDCNLNRTTITNCSLAGVKITDCNLTGVELADCNVKGMTIEGISVEELLHFYRENKQ